MAPTAITSEKKQFFIKRILGGIQAASKRVYPRYGICIHG
jgi:hypothetical protein